MIDVISSTLSDQNMACISCMFLENLAVKRTVDIQQYDHNIIDAMKADSAASCMVCNLLPKLATDEARIALCSVLRCFISAKDESSVCIFIVLASVFIL